MVAPSGMPKLRWQGIHVPVRWHLVGFEPKPRRAGVTANFGFGSSL